MTEESYISQDSWFITLFCLVNFAPQFWNENTEYAGMYGFHTISIALYLLWDFLPHPSTVQIIDSKWLLEWLGKKTKKFFLCALYQKFLDSVVDKKPHLHVDDVDVSN